MREGTFMSTPSVSRGRAIATRARLFFREAQYPWRSPRHDLAEVRRLIFKHGYLRRKEERGDAEAGLMHFAEAPTQ